MNENDIESELIKALSSGRPIRTNDLVQQLLQKHPDTRGFSNATIYRKIKQLKTRKIILELSSEEFQTYGISQTDGRATYLILKDSDERRKHLDEILDLLRSGDKADAITVYDDLEMYNRYSLTPSQLDQLIPGKTTDLDIAYRAIRILEDHIIRQHIVPTDWKKLIISLKTTLKRIGNKNLNIEEYSLKILGFYNDNFVIDQLVADAKNLEKMKTVEHYYLSPYCFKIIEKERTRLFELERSLRKPVLDATIQIQNYEVAQIIFKIRSSAANFMMYPRDDANLYSLSESQNE